ncbi:MAG: dihydrofolate reductase family protein [Chloroflexota bacterium]|nr:dihydrofolate reductase family protein [Chloroflexota bacterium]
MTELTPFELLRDDAVGSPVPLPERLAALYGGLRLNQPGPSKRIISNFVSTIDGVVALNDDGTSGGGEISGFNRHDRALMGLLRSVSDAIVVGAGTLRAAPQHLWNAARAFPELKDDYRELRHRLGKADEPLNVIVTASGNLDPGYSVFNSDLVQTLVVTTRDGARELTRRGLPPRVMVDAAGGEHLSARHVVRAIRCRAHAPMILVEGGPLLMAPFLREALIDELFLTIAPWIAGRDEEARRPGLVSGARFDLETFATLLSVRAATDHLFLRYALHTKDAGAVV